MYLILEVSTSVQRASQTSQYCPICCRDDDSTWDGSDKNAIVINRTIVTPLMPRTPNTVVGRVEWTRPGVCFTLRRKNNINTKTFRLGIDIAKILAILEIKSPETLRHDPEWRYFKRQGRLISTYRIIKPMKTSTTSIPILSTHT